MNDHYSWEFKIIIYLFKNPVISSFLLIQSGILPLLRFGWIVYAWGSWENFTAGCISTLHTQVRATRDSAPHPPAQHTVTVTVTRHGLFGTGIGLFPSLYPCSPTRTFHGGLAKGHCLRLVQIRVSCQNLWILGILKPWMQIWCACTQIVIETCS